jgi:hypothetical protein
METNDISLINKIYYKALQAADKPVEIQPPVASPIKPEAVRERYKYTPFQLNEAKKMAARVGVEEASRLTGVKSSTIYKIGQYPKKIKAKAPMLKKERKDLEIKRRMTTYVTAAKMALYWYSNICATMPGKSAKKKCFERAAIKYFIKPEDLWMAFTNNKIEGVNYP